MEKKNLVINAAMCDASGVSEEALAGYEKIVINAAALVESKAGKALFARYGVECNAAAVIETEAEDLEVSVTNGRARIGAGTQPPARPTVLMVNGALLLSPGAETALKGYVKVLVNGKVFCPESLSGVAAGMMVNGWTELYPDDCILLEEDTVLDKLFHLRVKEGSRFYVAGGLIAVDPALDPAKLAKKGVRFIARELIVAESLAEGVVPLVDQGAEIKVVPDGCAYVEDDAVLNNALLFRYGTRLYVDGDLTVDRESAEALKKLEFLRVEGDVELPRGMEEAFYAAKPICGEVTLCAGTVLRDRTEVTVDRALLEGAGDGVSLLDCLNVTFAPDVTPELIRERLFEMKDCFHIKSTPEQRSAIEPAAENCMWAGELARKMQEDENTRTINASSYKL